MDNNSNDNNNNNSDNNNNINGNNFLQDTHGNKSSKRLWGSILLGVGILFAITLFIYSLARGAADAATALGIINMFLIAGGGLLGIGVFEKGIIKTTSEDK